jgi:hypothetical protein
MILDQVNDTPWAGAWTNLVNDARQTFTPSLPKLVGVEVELVVANPGPPDEVLTMELLDSNEHSVVTKKTVSTAECDHVLFVFPDSGVEVSPGKIYSLQLTGGNTFGWKYVVGGYKEGGASFNGRALLPDNRSTFLFRTFGAKTGAT